MSAGKMVPLKHLARINERSLRDDVDPDTEIRYVDISAVGRGVLVEAPQRVRFGDAPSRARRLVAVGDTIVSTVRTYLRAVWPVEDVTDDLVVSTGFAVLTPQEVDPRYFSWWVRSDVFIDDVVARSVGVSYPAINALELGELPVRVPPPLEQRAIADYLNTETARIDALIAQKQRLVERLLERRAAFTIASVAGFWNVTERVACGVPWLETMPGHWRTAKLTLVAQLGSGHTPSRSRPDWWIDCSIPWVTTGEVAAMRSDRLEYVEDTREKLSEEGLANSAAVVHPAGTVVLCRTASAGYSAIMATDMATSQDFVTWTCGPLLRPRYLLLCLRAMRGDLLGRLAMGSTHKTIYMPDIESIRIPLPPVDEQDQIVDLVWQRLQRIDWIVDSTERQVELLRERRQVLITAAVTGELEVPGVAA